MHDRKRFELVYRRCEALYGRTPSDLEIERAYQRYIKIVG